ncbi:MAG: NAD(P)H-binding protein [Alphaproteobacteria bacterium]|nr:NAD(P)H-binding protein [Alphaproteobacteria bacterium]
MNIAILGATGKTGRYLVQRLCETGHSVIAIGRDPQRLSGIDPRARGRIADLERPEALHAALADAAVVVSLAHARFAQTVLESLPDTCIRVILTGSTRGFSRLPDPAADAVRAGEAAFLASEKPGVMLQPSMIYGAPDDRNVNRLLRYLRRWPPGLPAVVPLPDGGRHLVQPVFVDDVVDAFVAAIETPRLENRSIVVAGPEAMSYRDMVEACAKALGRRVAILSIPSKLLIAAMRVAQRIRLPVPVNASEVRRATEDKRFDVSILREQLGIAPRPFSEGLRLKLARGWV